MKKSFLTLFITAALLLPASVFAASASISVSVPSQAVAAGDTVLLPVMLNVPGPAGINAFSAHIAISGPAHIVNASTGGSVFTFWPEGPSVASDTVLFLGGTPGSVYGSPLRAVTVVVSAVSAGRVTIRVTHATAYAADGKGTPQLLKDSETSFVVGQKAASPRNELSDVLTKDTAPPDPFTIELGRDPSLYRDAYFISFATSDEGSGVVRYEVSENGSPAIATTSPYVLSDQSLSDSVTVHAVDAAGNVRTETLRFKPLSMLGCVASALPALGCGGLSGLVLVGVALLVAVLGYLYLRKRHHE